MVLAAQAMKALPSRAGAAEASGPAAEAVAGASEAAETPGAAEAAEAPAPDAPEVPSGYIAAFVHPIHSSQGGTLQASCEQSAMCLGLVHWV